MTKKESQKESGHSCPPAGLENPPAVTGWKTRAPLKGLTLEGVPETGRSLMFNREWLAISFSSDLLARRCVRL